jgi:hypothetical protein
MTRGLAVSFLCNKAMRGCCEKARLYTCLEAEDTERAGFEYFVA